MTKEEKIEILDGIILRAEKISYSISSGMTRCEDDAKSFIRNAISAESNWLDRLDRISWSPSIWTDSTPRNVFVEAWDSGKKEMIGVLESIKSEVELYSDMTFDDLSKPAKPTSDKVFIVHGHNDEMKLAVAKVITQLGLTSIILHEQPNKGRTIIEKFERLSQDISFAIVLLSADDLMDDGKYRARQNVILELGYFIAQLGRENVIALYDVASECEIVIPSDITGVLYEPYDKPDGSWRLEIVKELKAAGFDIDANLLI